MQPPPPSPLTTLAEKTDDWFRRANAALFTQVPCHAGCSSCCIGLFSVTRLDARRVQEGFRRLPPKAKGRYSDISEGRYRVLSFSRW